MFFIYSFIYTAVIIVLLLPEYLKRPGEFRSRWLREKFGYLPEASSAIWVHAVSVGEVGASIGLLHQLKKEYPDSVLVLSTITDTGQKVALERAPEGTTVAYLPFDIGFLLQRCVERMRPRILIVVETELWPNTFRTLSRSGIPVLVVNGRISERSSRGYRKVSFFMKKVFSFVKGFGMQGEGDAGRLIEIGAPGDKVKVIGNFKFDMGMPGEVPLWAKSLSSPVIVAGSTHAGEEEVILEAYRENRSRMPGLTLILAPRHPDRFREVEELLKSLGLPFIKRSAIGKAPATELGDREVVLLDTIGELSSIYGAADIAIIGKSFIGKGGQNPLEPAFWGKPIICGPHMENFPFIKDFYREGAAFEVGTNNLAKKIRELLLSPESGRAAGRKAKDLFMRNSGAVDRAMEMIRSAIHN
jgi:3-deoxy-D-manno-octulosonic-acid transferase